MTESAEAAPPPVADFPDFRMRRFVLTATLGFAGVLAVGALLALGGGWLAAATGLGGGLMWPASAVPGLVAALDGFSFVADVGRHAGWVVLPALVIALLIRRRPRLAGVVAVAGAGGVVLGATAPLLAGIWGWASGAGGEEQHASFFDDVLGLTVNAGVLLLVLLPALRERTRPWLLGVAGLVVIGFGMLAAASGSATVPAVVGGWLIGAAWLTVVVVAFRMAVGVRPGGGRFGAALPDDDADALRPAPVGDRVPPSGFRGVLLLVGAAVLLGAGMLAVGLFVILPSQAAQQFDETVIRWFVGIRGDPLTALATTIDTLGNTPGILAVHLAAIPITLALTRRRAPTVFLLTAVVGETALYLGVAAAVNRHRPTVDHLTMELPATSSFPSGHVAATLVTYGGIALLLHAWSRSRWRHLALVTAVLLVLAVAVVRLYWGLHYPTDTLVSILYATAWLAVCWWAIRPGRRGDAPHRNDAPAAAGIPAGAADG